VEVDAVSNRLIGCGIGEDIEWWWRQFTSEWLPSVGLLCGWSFEWFKRWTDCVAAAAGSEVVAVAWRFCVAVWLLVVLWALGAF
jgi:hypothetical protein